MPEAVEQKITIKRGNVSFDIQRNELIEIKPTHDGIMFQLKENMYIYSTEISMPSEVKQKIIIAFDQFKTGNIIIDLLNYVNPARINLV